MTTVHLDVESLTLLGWVIPLVVGVVTKKWAHPGIKAVANLVLSAATGAIAVAVQANGNVVLKTWLLNMAAVFVQSIVAYYGVWKPTTVADLVQNATASFGVGSATSTSAAAPRTRLSYEDLKAIRADQPPVEQTDEVGPETARTAMERDRQLDDFGNRVLNGEATVLSESVQPEVAPQDDGGFPGKASPVLSYEDSKAVVSEKLTNGAAPIVKSDPKASDASKVVDLDKPAKKPAKKVAAKKKAPAKKAPARKAAAKRTSR